MPANDIEAFEYVVSDAETGLELDYLTYAMFAYKKKKWIEHYANGNGGASPNQGQIDGWISQLTEYDFQQMRNEAGAIFDSAAKEYLDSYIQEEKKRAVDTSMLNEV